MINPHFDHNRVIWKDEYTGLYQPVDYSKQFDPEWQLFLEKKPGFIKHTGVELEDEWINDRIYDLTGVSNYFQLSKDKASRDMGGRQYLDLRFSPSYFKHKSCLDAACGAGRWTKTLMTLGAKVKSIDVSEHGLKSVKRFNEDAEKQDIFGIIQNRPDLHERFDFTICWGVVMCTHDPKVAFENIARTVKPGGGMYIMVYAPTYHNSPEVLKWRKHYHTLLKTFEERLAYSYEISDTPENAINYLDMLNTYYNWVIDEETIHAWYAKNGFVDIVTLNASEKLPCNYHVFGRKRKLSLPYRNDYGEIILRTPIYDTSLTKKINAPYQKETGYAWQASLPEYATSSDNTDYPYRSSLILIEDGKPLLKRHASHQEIRAAGMGSYSHWQNALLFSTSDNTDPNLNGRTYEIVFADSAE